MTSAGWKTGIAMAWRNLSRHRVKTIITVTAIAVSVGLYIYMDAWLLGMRLDSSRNIISYEIGAAKIQTAGYFEKKDDFPMYESFPDWQPIASALDRAGYICAPRFVFPATVLSRTGSAPVLVNAVDPSSEAKLLRYTTWLESGRYIRDGALEIVVGSFAAEKLRIGIPQRPDLREYERDVLSAAATEEEATFIASLYELMKPGSENTGKLFAPVQRNGVENGGRMVLRPDNDPQDMERLWTILARTGRMDVRLSTVIDLAAAPALIRQERFQSELLDVLSPADQAILLETYEQDPLLGDWFLTAEDDDDLDRVLAVLAGIGWNGAIRHVNQAIDAVVVGIINSPNPKNNGNVAFIPLSSLEGSTGMMLDGQITELLVRSKNARDASLPGRTEQPDAVRSALVKALADDGVSLPDNLSVYGWQDYVGDYLAAYRQDSVTSRVMALFLFLLSFIGIANTMLMAVLERTREIGMLRALGMTDRQVLGVYALEAGMVGCIGALAGMIIGILINIPMVNYGLDFSAMAKEMGGDFGYRITSLFRSAWNPVTIVVTGIVATLLSAIMAIPPTRRALRMPVTETLRFD